MLKVFWVSYKQGESKVSMHQQCHDLISSVYLLLTLLGIPVQQLTCHRQVGCPDCRFSFTQVLSPLKPYLPLSSRIHLPATLPHITQSVLSFSRIPPVVQVQSRHHLSKYFMYKQSGHLDRKFTFLPSPDLFSLLFTLSRQLLPL